MDYLTEESVHLEGKAIEKAFVPYKCQDDEKGIAALEEFLRSESSELEKN